MRWLAWGSWSNFPSHIISKWQGFSSNPDLSGLKIHAFPFHYTMLSFLSKQPVKYVHVISSSFHTGSFCFLNSEFWSERPTVRDLCEKPRKKTNEINNKTVGVCILTRVKCQVLEILGNHLPDTQAGSSPQTVGKLVTHRSQPWVPFRWQAQMSDCNCCLLI